MATASSPSSFPALTYCPEYALTKLPVRPISGERRAAFVAGNRIETMLLGASCYATTK
jgi:hypothetical protein